MRRSVLSFAEELNRTKSMVVDRISRGGPAAVKFERLHDLVRFNYSYNCFQAIRKAKAALSEQPETVIDIPELVTSQEPLVGQFEHFLDLIEGTKDAAAERGGEPRTRAPRPAP